MPRKGNLSKPTLRDPVGRAHGAVEGANADQGRALKPYCEVGSASIDPDLPLGSVPRGSPKLRHGLRRGNHRSLGSSKVRGDVPGNPPDGVAQRDKPSVLRELYE